MSDLDDLNREHEREAGYPTSPMASYYEDGHPLLNTTGGTALERGAERLAKETHLYRGCVAKRDVIAADPGVRALVELAEIVREGDCHCRQHTCNSCRATAALKIWKAGS